MINKEVVPAFDMLLEELETIIPELNKQGSSLMDEKKYPEAKAVISKAEGVMAFQAKVKALRDEWLGLDVPATRSTQSKKRNKKTSFNVPSRLKKGQKTSEEAFRMPILQALRKLGGRGTKTQVINLLEEIMGSKLNVYDWQTLPSNNKDIRWINTAAWARQKLVYDGFLADDSPVGTWEITIAGRLALEESKKKFVAEKPQQYLPIETLNHNQNKPVFSVGKRYHRATELHGKYGGNIQSGISPCSKAPIIFLFQSPSGKEAGYKDGWASEDTYEYTGQGQIGDMQFTLGNKAILNHQADGRVLHLFKKQQSGLYEYLGEFKYQSHRIEEGLDSTNQSRKMIRFVLKKA